MLSELDKSELMDRDSALEIKRECLHLADLEAGAHEKYVECTKMMMGAQNHTSTTVLNPDWIWICVEILDLLGLQAWYDDHVPERLVPWPHRHVAQDLTDASLGDDAIAAKLYRAGIIMPSPTPPYLGVEVDAEGRGRRGGDCAPDDHGEACCGFDNVTTNATMVGVKFIVPCLIPVGSALAERIPHQSVQKKRGPASVVAHGSSHGPCPCRSALDGRGPTSVLSTYQGATHVHGPFFGLLDEGGQPTNGVLYYLHLDDSNLGRQKMVRPSS